MTYRLVARERVFCEGSEAECQNTFTVISQMMSAGLTTEFQIEEFSIIKGNKNELV